MDFDQLISKAKLLAVDIWTFELLKVENSAITLGTLAVGGFLLISGFILAKKLSSRISHKALSRWSLDPSMRHTLESVLFYIFLLFFSLFAMKMANLPITIFTVVGGAVAIGVGFGSQNVVNNFISGIILMIERPMKVGDFIEVDGIVGYVTDIGMRSTIVEAPGFHHLIVPNSSFLEKTVKNWTLHSDDRVRLDIKVGVAYGSPCDKIKSILEKVAAAEPRILTSPEPIVLLTDFGESSLDFELYAWINLRKLSDRAQTSSDLRFAIDTAFRQESITIPFPQRDIHVYNKDS